MLTKDDSVATWFITTLSGAKNVSSRLDLFSIVWIAAFRGEFSMLNLEVGAIVNWDGGFFGRCSSYAQGNHAPRAEYFLFFLAVFRDPVERRRLQTGSYARVRHTGFPHYPQLRQCNENHRTSCEFGVCRATREGCQC